MIEISALLDLISDRQLQEYVIWLTNHPDSNEEESIAYLMDILNDSQVDILLEKDFKATPYSSWYGACITPDGRCFEATMSDCRVLGGQFQGPGTSCGGHYSKPVMMSAEEELFDCGVCDKTIYENDNPQDDDICDDCLETHKQCSVCQDYEPYNEMTSCFTCGQNYCGSCDKYDSCEEYNAPPGKVFHDPAAARDPRLKNDNPPASVTQYLKKHPEVANLYDDDDASVMIKGIVIGCLIGALGTIFGNLASEMIMDKFKITPQFKWDQ